MTRKLLALLISLTLFLGALPALSLAEETVTFTDSCGREVEIPTDISRIVPAGAVAQIMLFAIAPEYFVGLSTDWAKEAEPYLGEYYNLPLIGQLYGGKGELNLEELAALDPQIIIDVGEAKASVAEDMDALTEQLGIPTVHIDAYTATFADSFRMLGKLLGLEERGEALAVYCEKIYARGEEIMAQVADEDRVQMLYLPAADGLSVTAKDSYHSELFDMLAENVAVVDAPSSKGTGNEIDMEQLLLWDPEVIIFAPNTIYATVGDDPLWQDLWAIQEGNYVEAPFGPYNWLGFPPSVQRYLGILWLCDLFYPDLCDYDLYEEVAEYYELFYHCELTEEQFESLTANAYVAE